MMVSVGEQPHLTGNDGSTTRRTPGVWEHQRFYRDTHTEVYWDGVCFIYICLTGVSNMFIVGDSYLHYRCTLRTHIWTPEKVVRQSKGTINKFVSAWATLNAGLIQPPFTSPILVGSSSQTHHRSFAFAMVHKRTWWATQSRKGTLGWGSD